MFSSLRLRNGMSTFVTHTASDYPVVLFSAYVSLDVSLEQSSSLYNNMQAFLQHGSQYSFVIVDLNLARYSTSDPHLVSNNHGQQSPRESTACTAMVYSTSLQYSPIHCNFFTSNQATVLAFGIRN